MLSRVDLKLSISEKLKIYERMEGSLTGISQPQAREALLEQLVDSIHRVQYIERVKNRPISPKRTDPADEVLFDPLRAAMYHYALGNVDEAYWLIFLFVHFGKHAAGGWRYSREFYGRLGQGRCWDWPSVCTQPTEVEAWIADHVTYLKRPGAGFGNHRKYESWQHTAQTIQSYVQWVGPTQKHNDVVAKAIYAASGDPIQSFDLLYHSMNDVYRFGRTARFDYLTMLAKMGLADIKAGSAYIAQATGPKLGGRLLLGIHYARSAEIDRCFVKLAHYLDVGLQEIEDSVCNWQKSPAHFVRFRG